MSGSAIIDDLKARGLVHDTTDEAALRTRLDEGPITLYHGIDPSASSLHLGNLIGILVLRRFQDHGHLPIALVGGSTGMVGDPGGRSEERNLLDTATLEGNVEGIRSQVERLVGVSAGKGVQLVNNFDWTKDVGILDFLRDVGKHATVNQMVAKESVRTRMNSEQGISFTEFSYMLLQAYDFYELNKRYNCSVQVGGSDQWGNITGGIDLTRRMHKQQVFGVTTPLVTKADGSKFGKTESGTIWISPTKTSPYAFYQFWLNVADADVYKFLRYFTFLSPVEIAEIERSDREAQGRPEAQGILAREATRLVHGEEGYTAAARISQALFSGDIGRLTESDLAQLELDGLPCAQLEALPVGLVDALVRTGLAKSNKMAREFIGNKAVSVNGEVISEADAELTGSQALHGQYLILKRGKKLFHLAKLPRS